MKEVSETLSTVGWKQIEKWIRYCIDVWISTDRLREVKDGKTLRQPTLEEVAIWNLKIEARIKSFRFLLDTLKNSDIEKEEIQNDLDEIKKIKEGK